MTGSYSELKTQCGKEADSDCLSRAKRSNACFLFLCFFVGVGREGGGSGSGGGRVGSGRGYIIIIHFPSPFVVVVGWCFPDRGRSVARGGRGDNRPRPPFR